MRVKLWGVRGSIPVPGAAAAGFGGNTSCVGVTTGDGTELILDAGSGIRELGAAISGRCRQVHVLLTHLHLDHIQGLTFFAPLFDPAVEVTVWGPPAAGRALRERLARFISSPLCPVEIRELPAHVNFEDAPSSPWRIGGVEVRAALVAHRGPTLGYRLTADTASLCYLPDHEPGLGQDLARAGPAWISGHALAAGASLLIHDCQYADAEYRARRGWGHSSVSDALAFAHRAGSASTLLFHHDPGHDDAHLDAIGEEAARRWTLLERDGNIEMAREGRSIELDTRSGGAA
jgi:phosphoribosyl 1,2-cyclic phosphodiesterase